MLCVFLNNIIIITEIVHYFVKLANGGGLIGMWKDGFFFLGTILAFVSRDLDLGEIGLWGGEWIKLAQDSNRWQYLVNTMMNHRVLAPEVCYEM
jgi:hypothetical protein